MAITTLEIMTKSELYLLPLSDVKKLGKAHREQGYSIYYDPYRHAPLTTEMSDRYLAWAAGWHESNAQIMGCQCAR
jgi:hypothetical protein